ncbi:type I restriction enzyme S subunit [Actinocrispum wychmicini]|uniref:Type I restriction enzyme S subunit n=1 Tax=Actinocrispum wychmicini TaxID=1213861 RepID=A0A4V2S444_9PSEU|nr:type I restriction enzyme S subunit [Actinocrispum wychmicini]
MNGRLSISWPVVPLGELARVYSGGTPSRGVPTYWGGGIPWVTTAEIDAGFIASARETITEAGLKASAARIAPPGTLLLAMYGQGKTRGKAALLRIPAAMNQACAAIEVGSRLDGRYLLYYLASRYDEIRSMSNAGSQENLSGELVRRIPIAVPPICEQRAIAALLSDADDLIAQQERTITKKQAIKQGVMQQLLAGRARLPGFTEPWVESRVGNFLEFKNGLNKASQFFGSGTPIVNFMDVMNGPFIAAADMEGRVTLTRDEIRRFSAKRGDLFFTRTSETVDEVGTAAVLIEDIPDATFSGFILRGRPHSAVCESRFIAYLFQIDSVRSQVTSAASYTTRALTNGRSLGRVVVRLPSLGEQCAISSVLEDSEAEISALRERLKKALSIKQGMMQQLLTGRIRLPVKQSAA